MPTRRTKQDQLPLRGFLSCTKCGKTLTGSGSKGNGGKYYYYHCFDGCKERFKAPAANDIFYGLLTDISGNKKLIKTIEAITTNVHKNSNKEQEIQSQKIDKEIKTYRTRLDNAQTLMLDGELDAADYRNIKAKLQPEIENLVKQQRLLNEKNPEEQEIMKFGIFIFFFFGVDFFPDVI